jgi:NitT/TauT family transport system substrate-binding protein
LTRIVVYPLIALLISCGENPNSRTPKVRLGIAAQQSISQVPVYLAQQIGFYQAKGIDVELAEFPGASKGLEALIGGSIDVLSGYYTQGLQIRQQGREIEAFFSIYDSLLITLAVAPSATSRIQKIDDLRGAKVGVTTLGSATHQYLDFLLRSHGMPPDSVTPIAIGTAARAAAAMERGVVDAGIVTDFTIRYLERRFGQIRLLSDSRTRAGVKQTHGVDAFPGTVLLAHREWLNRNPDAARKLSKAIGEAMAWMKAHTASEVVGKMPPSHYGEDREAYDAAMHLAIPLLSTRPVDDAGHRAAVEFLNLPAATPSIFVERIP